MSDNFDLRYKINTFIYSYKYLLIYFDNDRLRKKEVKKVVQYEDELNEITKWF